MNLIFLLVTRHGNFLLPLIRKPEAHSMVCAFYIIFQVFYFAVFNLVGDYGHTKYFVSASVDLPGFDKSENVEFNVNRYRFL